MRGKYILGKCDYTGSGRRNCEAVFTWKLENGEFSMCGEIWRPNHSDIYMGGQCCEDILDFFPNDNQAKRMVRVWRRWHLNKLRAGSPRQEEWLRKNKVLVTGKDYAQRCALLTEAGLNPDAELIIAGKPYSYGSKWLKEELPDEIIQEILSWEISTN